MADINFAIEACKLIESFAPNRGCHVALTGGCLYKDGDRKDIDILFYRVRQVTEIDLIGLLHDLELAGFSRPVGFGWLYKSEYKGVNFDMLFPESAGDDEYDPTVDYKAAVNAITMANNARVLGL
jgi:hypothetical protein